MSSDYYRLQARLDPVFETFPNGICRQEIELHLSDDPDVSAWKSLLPVICRIDAPRARTLAFELLVLAEQAENFERMGGPQ